MSKSSEYHQFFPYNTYRSGKEEIIRQIEEGTRLKKKNFLLSAPNGTGKTVIVLRPIRRETDKGVIIFMDERFKKRSNWISEWVRNEIRVVPDRKGIISSLSHQFWNR